MRKFHGRSKNRMIKKKETSNEIICVTLRIEPIWLYFKLSAQPLKLASYSINYKTQRAKIE